MTSTFLRPYRSLTIFMALFFIFISHALSFATEARQPSIPRYVRVAVTRDQKCITLSLKGRYRILALHTYQPLYEGNSLRNADASPAPDGIKIDDLYLKVYGVKIQTKKRGAIWINDRRFRGDVDIIRTQNQRLLVVNHIDVEDYLCGVLYHEVSPYWPMEVLKAQAIAARTFALYQSRVNAGSDYDLTSDIYSQVYGGRTSERWRTNRAVKHTRGSILTYKGEIFPTYYHATCGGHTERAGEIWKIDIEPLRGVVCDFCRRSPHFEWKETVPVEEMERKLAKAGYEFDQIRSIEVVDRDTSHRIRQLKVSDSKTSTLISAYKFRLAMNPNTIRSTDFQVKMNDEYAFFEGRGWGHGVGLCQWGAQEMAEAGYNHEEILKYYYPGSEITNVDKVLRSSE